ncbi:subtilase family protease [Nitzschia inconspicua]|uniref:Subtilase family protease n=1 Tax=Nitzschia inconspicua TaxID=303405 RepID=A0A9K3LRG8_9STRA|nr:subtilase family protease [Nitzschia inconspicua]
MKSTVASFVAIASVQFQRISSQTDFTCEFLNDQCISQFDGKCDSVLGNNTLPGCGNSDCFDCNLCSQFNADCKGCLEAKGCFYCPGDGTCNNAPTYIFEGAIQSCLEPVDYLVGGAICSLSPDDNFFNDPLYDGQRWVYDMINIVPVWEKGYSGKGVRVRVNDDGVENTHPEFEGRFDINGSCTVSFPQLDGADGHGTSVASIVGGAASNDKCAAGIAPEITISSCNIFAEVSLTILSEKLQSFDISQNSWGVPTCGVGLSEGKRQLQTNATTCPFSSRPMGLIYEHPCDVCDFQAEIKSPQCEVAIVTHCKTNGQYKNDEFACLDFLELIVGGDCSYDKLPDYALQALSEGVLNGRDGKGVVYVFASGNELASGDDVNFSGLTNSRLTITVGGVGKDGMRASYSTPGAALFVVAPGGSLEAISNHMAATLSGGCIITAPGTSFAAPVISGVVALMLEANPDLTWRDVQGILATTSQIIADVNDISATINGAGIWHSNNYGFGLVDALAAVSAAENWTLVNPEAFLVGESGEVNLTISDLSTSPTVSKINITGGTEVEDLIIESVAVFLQVEHFSRGDLEISLRSPAGTISLLTPGRRIENTQLGPDQRWKLLTVRNWGESAIGIWELSIRDLNPGDVATCADAPFALENDNEIVTCSTVDDQQWCFRGVRNPETTTEQNIDILFTQKVNGMTLSEACCTCGGGLTASDVNDRLLQWKLIVYGQKDGIVPASSSNENETSLESFTPTTAPTVGNRTIAPRPNSADKTVETEPTIANQPPKTEKGIVIAGTVMVFFIAAVAVRWAFKPPTSSGKFTVLNKTAEIA